MAGEIFLMDIALKAFHNKATFKDSILQARKKLFRIISHIVSNIYL